MRVVVDTNVFVSSFLSPKGTPRKIIDLWKKGDVIFCLSPAIIEEYVLVLGRLGLEGEPEMGKLLELFKKKVNILFTAPKGDLKVVEADRDDDKFIECALHARAGFVISGDKHLLDVGSYEGIRIVTPAEFLDLFETGVH
jgi:putative PIN family toxin of toxin-antitoxin system